MLLIDAVKAANQEAARQGVEAGDDLEQRDAHVPNGATALLPLCVLLEAGADVHARTRAGETALHLCQSITKGRRLIARGADPNARDSGGRTPLQTHVLQGRTNLADWLAPLTADPDADSADDAASSSGGR